MNFQIKALDHNRFVQLFAMSDTALADMKAVRQTATSKPGFPCRVSLADAEAGEELILVNFEHQDGASPYRAAHAIFVPKDSKQVHPDVGEVPELFIGRMLSLRAFNDQAMIVAADLIDGQKLGASLNRLLDDPATAYVHIHYAKFGCFAARADRA